MGTHKHNHKAYFILISVELGSIAIMYQDPNPNNQFQQSSPICFLFLTSVFCHAVTTMADMNLPTTMIIFHISGIVGCETLLWIILPVFWKWYIINLFLLLVTSVCFFNAIRTIPKLFLPTHSTATQPPKPQESSQPPKPKESSQPVQQSSSNIMHLFFLYPRGMIRFAGLLASNELQLWEAESISTRGGCYAMSLYISYAPKLLTHIVTTFGFSMMHHVKIAPRD